MRTHQRNKQILSPGSGKNPDRLFCLVVLYQQTRGKKRKFFDFGTGECSLYLCQLKCPKQWMWLIAWPVTHMVSGKAVVLLKTVQHSGCSWTSCYGFRHGRCHAGKECDFHQKVLFTAGSVLKRLASEIVEQVVLPSFARFLIFRPSRPELASSSTGPAARWGNPGE